MGLCLPCLGEPPRTWWRRPTRKLREDNLQKLQKRGKWRPPLGVLRTHILWSRRKRNRRKWRNKLHLQALEEAAVADLDGRLDKEVWHLKRRGSNTANNLPVSAAEWHLYIVWLLLFAYEDSTVLCHCSTTEDRGVR